MRDVTHFEKLTHAGIELPDPDAMDERQLTSKLWEVVGALARRRVFIRGTDHLSDRELYSVLWHDVLRRANPCAHDDDLAVRVRPPYDRDRFLPAPDCVR